MVSFQIVGHFCAFLGPNEGIRVQIFQFGTKYLGAEMSERNDNDRSCDHFDTLWSLLLSSEALALFLLALLETGWSSALLQRSSASELLR